MGQAPPRLQLEGIAKAYPGVQALAGVDLELRAGEILGLLGQNGAGKSTLVKILSGAEKPDRGTITMEGRPVHFHRPAEAQAAGIYTIFQEFSLVFNLTVAENIYLSDIPTRGGWVSFSKMRAMAREALARLNFENIDVDALVREISVAEQQIVEIAKALHHKSKVILFDEPTATLSAPDVEKLFHILKQLAANGVSLLYITHHLEEVSRICDRVSILRDGRHLTTQSVAELGEDRIVSLMLGKEADDLAAARRESTGHRNRAGPRGGKTSAPALEIRNLSDEGFIHGISLNVMPGESVSVTGLVGSGQLQLAACAFGARTRTSGEVLVHGRRVQAGSPRASVRAGLGWVPEDRKSQGLVLNLSVACNLTMSSLERVSHFSLLNRARENSVAAETVRSLGIKVSSLAQPVRGLSGGNQQKVVFGKWLRARSRAMILSEPTRGVDVGAREEIYREIRSFLDDGGAALVVTSDIDEALLFDRIYVIARGRLVGEFSHGQLDSDRFLSMLR